ncbi:ABC transporter ATP-binding protein [Blastococcus saxobsidens]|uniref:ABC transporter ATP-binding protein n=1 Tax=Blastococcus saxobsidens TaxID=138336 RepID=A0A6L9W2P0_9ACTN|nr:ABC transporter ATP-binding protein [Blastococcus saxobsidens]NEK86305.1 ABC transporter ATP-binding protein [Blastococcus saxobsidens]
MPAVEMVGVTKTYRRRGGQPFRALDSLDMTVDTGGVHGLLGPNGSGKTTSIRALLGLVRPDAGVGQIRLLDRPVPDELPQLIGDVGALVETPLFFPAFSGRRNLELLAQTAGVPGTRVEECLELVDLRDRAGDRFKGYSLGMKQRLGIAAALLKSPRLLILDEPSNGLDPAGIRDIRELVRRLGRDGRTTVLVSSHLLAEIQHVCDSVTILVRGRRIASGPVASVLSRAGTNDTRVAVPDPATAAALLAAAGFSVSPSPDGQILVHGAASPGEITRVLAQHGHYVEELVRVTPDLEEAFLALTGNQA